MNKVKYSTTIFILTLLMSLYIQPVLAEEKLHSDNTYLRVARNQLSIAFDKYNDGDITAAKNNLNKASNWLHKAVAHSKYDKIKIEAAKLASEIDRFRQTLNHSSEKNDIVRLWHKATSLVIRESEQLVHSYIESSNDNVILKHLLDAKMHFFLAEHELFVSHDWKDAVQELNDTVEYLGKANTIVNIESKTRVNNLIANIKVLISLTESGKDSWKKDKLIDSLDKAIINITNATSISTLPTKLRLQSIEENIEKLKFDIQKTNIRTKYKSIMTDFIRAIKNI